MRAENFPTIFLFFTLTPTLTLTSSRERPLLGCCARKDSRSLCSYLDSLCGLIIHVYILPSVVGACLTCTPGWGLLFPSGNCWLTPIPKCNARKMQRIYIPLDRQTTSSTHGASTCSARVACTEPLPLRETCLAPLYSRKQRLTAVMLLS